MNQQYVTLIAALLSVLVGSLLTLLSSHFTNHSAEKRLQKQLKHEAHQRQQELLRTRGEELYAVTSAWLRMIVTHHMRKTYVMLGNITYDQAVDLELKADKPLPDFERIGLLVDVYFPSVRSAYDVVLAVRDERNEIEMTFDRDYKRNGPSERHKEFLPAFGKELLTLEKSVNTLKKQIVESLRSIGSEQP
jgi:hypothetical protein